MAIAVVVARREEADSDALEGRDEADIEACKPELSLALPHGRSRGMAYRTNQSHAVPTASTSIRRISAAELETLVPELVELLTDVVNAGSWVGFRPPLAHDVARNYWLSLRAELQAGSRVLLVAEGGDRIAGSGQLMFPSWPDPRQSAQVQKLFVAAALRRGGVGRSLMMALHDAARQYRRTLLVLRTLCGAPSEAFYKGLGHRQIGLVADSSTGPTGARYDSVNLYRELSA